MPDRPPSVQPPSSRTARRRTLCLAVVIPLAAQLAGCASSRDIVPESHDVVTTAPPPAEGGYEYIIRRPFGVVAVAESRGLDRDVVRGIADHLATSLDSCAARLAADGRLVHAAARIAAHIARDGTPVGVAITVTPGPAPAANALVCFVSPFKLVRFPSADSEPALRGLALEATWGVPAPPTASPPPAATSSDH